MNKPKKSKMLENETREKIVRIKKKYYFPAQNAIVEATSYKAALEELKKLNNK